MLLMELAILIFLGPVLAEAGRILVMIPTPSFSHQVAFRPITQELARRGHEVTVITTDPAFPKGQTPENLTEIDLHDVSYEIWRQTFVAKATRGDTSDHFNQLHVLLSALTEIFEAQIKAEEVQNVIGNYSSNHFDLIIVEAWVRSALSLSHIFKAPTIAVCSWGGMNYLFEAIGAPYHPALLYPTVLRHRLFNLSLSEKVKELYYHYRFDRIIENHQERDSKFLKSFFGPDMPTIKELQNNIDMLFLNVHPMWEFNRPVPTNVIFMGGVHQESSKELPQDLKSYLDSSKNGVIYVSYGTNVDPCHLPPEKIQIMIKILSQLPYDVLWKWDRDELPGKSKNIRIAKWLPQADLLKHPKIKLFITQGGLQSTDEALTGGVPFIGMPMLGDQWFNVELYVHYKIGIRLDMHLVTEENFKEAITTIVNDNSYRKNVVKLRSVMNDQPQKPLDRAVWWAEHVMRHGGGSHLRAGAANISWSEYLDLELCTFLVLVALVIIIVVSYTVYLIFTFIRRSLFTSRKLKNS